MDDVAPAIVLVLALLAAIYVVNRAGRTVANKAPPGASPGTLRLGQYAVQPGAQWLVLQNGDY